MGKPRLQLQSLLKTLTPNVYYQAPDSVKMQYPAIRYELSDARKEYADNGTHLLTRQYELTLITENPDDVILDALLQLPMCQLDRHFVAPGLHHYVFNIFF